ncbi:MAG: hypothetical protein RJB01_622 [Actinomycetota bacterium]
MESHITLALRNDVHCLADVRALVASMCARAGFSVNQLEDAKLAVNEALTIAMLASAGESSIRCALDVSEKSLRARVGVRPAIPAPSAESLAWMVLQGICQEVAFTAELENSTISLSVLAHEVAVHNGS